jgi:hypothetical protein
MGGPICLPTGYIRSKKTALIKCKYLPFGAGFRSSDIVLENIKMPGICWFAS